MKPLKIVFMGTPNFAAHILEGIIPYVEVSLVVTQPDTLVGRKRQLTVSPVKEIALKYQLPIFQPVHIKEQYQEVIDTNPDLIITAAYGQFVPSSIIDTIPSMNVHGSLLPMYRGGAPIQKAIMDGQTETGITLIHMTKKMDAGNMISKRSLPIELTDTYSTLSKKMSQIGLEMVIETLKNNGKHLPEGIPQDLSQVTFSPILKREDERLYFHYTTSKFINHMRALLDHPVGHIMVSEMPIKIYDAVKSDIIASGVPGEVIQAKGKLIIMCADGPIELKVIQLPGKQKMDVKSFLNGQHIIKEKQVLI